MAQAYRPVEDRAHLGETLLEYLEEYNVEFPSQMHLVFFADAVAHVRYHFHKALLNARRLGKNKVLREF